MAQIKHDAKRLSSFLTDYEIYVREVLRPTQQEITQLIFQVGHVVACNCIGHFVGFLDRVRRNAREILFEVPGTAGFGGPQPGHDGQQALHGRVARLRMQALLVLHRLEQMQGLTGDARATGLVEAVYASLDA